MWEQADTSSAVHRRYGAFAEDEKGMGESLKVLQEWCVDWSLRVNGNKCRVIHFRRKGEERSKALFNVGQEPQEAIRIIQ